MMRKSMSAMPSDRIQLSNQRANTERRGGPDEGGTRGLGAVAPVPVNGAPKSCMRLILVIPPARRNSDTPSPSRTPLPNSDSEFADGVGMAHPRGETGDPPLAFDTTPCDGRLRQRVERVTGEWRASGRENHDDRLVGHATR